MTRTDRNRTDHRSWRTRLDDLWFGWGRLVDRFANIFMWAWSLLILILGILGALWLNAMMK